MMSLTLIIALAAGVWGFVLFSRGSLMAGALAVVICGTVFGHSFYALEGGPLPITSDRALLALLVFAYAVCRWRQSSLADPKPPGAAEWTMLAFIGVLAFTMFTHDWRQSEMSPVRNFVFYWLMPLALYWVARQSTLTERRTLWMFAALAGLGLYLGATAIAEWRGQWWAVFPKYIASPEYYEFFGRGRGPLLNPVGNAIFLITGLAAVVMWWPRTGPNGRLFLMAAMVVVLGGVYATLTRSCWMGAGLAIFVAGALALPRAWRGATLMVMLASTIIGGALFWETLLSFKRDKDLSAAEVKESVELRPLLAAVAWSMFLDRPLLGHGYGNYRVEAADYVNDRTSDLELEKVRPYVQHNVFLAMLVDTGAVGLGLFLTLLGLWTRDAWRLWRAVEAPLWARQVGLMFMMMLAGYLPNAMFHDLSLISMVNMLLFFVAGVTRAAAGQVLDSEQRATASSEPPVRLAWATR